MTENENGIKSFRLLDECSGLLNKLLVYRVKVMNNKSNAEAVNVIEEVIGMEFPANEVQELTMKINSHLGSENVVNVENAAEVDA